MNGKRPIGDNPLFLSHLHSVVVEFEPEAGKLTVPLIATHRALLGAVTTSITRFSYAHLCRSRI